MCAIGRSRPRRNMRSGLLQVSGLTSTSNPSRREKRLYAPVLIICMEPLNSSTLSVGIPTLRYLCQNSRLQGSEDTHVPALACFALATLYMTPIWTQLTHPELVLLDLKPCKTGKAFFTEGSLNYGRPPDGRAESWRCCRDFPGIVACHVSSPDGAELGVERRVWLRAQVL